jgi:hypothetical protein
MEFNIISSTLNTSYNYKNTIIVQGSYVRDEVSGNLQSINGSCYRINAQGEMGDYIGNFNGYPQSDGDITYDLSQMNRSDSELVWDAIDDIQNEVIPTDESE